MVDARLRDDVGHGRLRVGFATIRGSRRPRRFQPIGGRLVPARQYLRHSCRGPARADTAADMHRSMAAARWRATALLASIVGAAASAYLLVEYVTGQPGVCLTGSGCDLVRASAFAYPLGIPTPLIGLVFYLVAGWVVLRTLDSRRWSGLAPGTALLVLAAGGGHRLDGADRARGVRHQGLLHLVPGAGGREPRPAGAPRSALRAHRPRARPPRAHSRRARQQASRAVEGERRGLSADGAASVAAAARWRSPCCSRWARPAERRPARRMAPRSPRPGIRTWVPGRWRWSSSPTSSAPAAPRSRRSWPTSPRPTA